ncbi:hypothetical protein LTR94_037781, partial [Friedmanniomyces endolithicus]
GPLLDRRRRRPPGRARSENRARPHRRGRARPVPPLHAERDLRAAARHRRHARGRDRRDAGTVRRRRLRRVQEDRP